MLGKLLKHEWKSIGKVPAILLGVLFAVTIMAGFTFVYPFWDSETVSGAEFLVVMIWMLFYGVLIGVSVGISLYLAVHFYKSMYTDEGYLTHTLPVTPRQLLVSKLLPMAGWLYIASVAIVLAIGLFAGMAVLFARPEGVTLAEFMTPVWAELKLAFAELGEQGGAGFMFSMVLMVLVSGFSGAMMVIGSVTVGQLVGKHKILGSIGAYFVINSITSFVSMIAMIPTMIGTVNNGEVVSAFEILTPTYLVTTIIMAVISVALFFVSELIVRKKLNLD